MLSGQHIHLHQALGLGPMWLSHEAYVCDAPEHAMTVVSTAAPVLAIETTSVLQDALQQRPTPKAAQAIPIQTPAPTPAPQTKPVPAEAVQRKVTQRAANLLAIIAQAQHQNPKTTTTAAKTPTTSTKADYSQDTLTSLTHKIRHCQLCDLSANRRQALVAHEISDCRLIVVLPQPSLEDDIHGHLLSGEIMEMWQKLIKAIGLTSQQVYVTSAIKCSPNLELVAKQHHAAQCRSYLERELQLLPKVPVLLLAENQERLWQRLQEWCGSERLFRIPHPSKMQRNPAIKRSAWETLQKLQPHL
ncbi:MULTISPECIES: uracil-DNA glycosylase family protein [Vitreoscilla]|uniref:Uracil-DNA glycosylase-like domain-containing protein n=1 Tax=Vitreoscilla stercoraria TaxID=61 RepID=A0ABY4EBA2_VITST|nr:MULTISPECIES: uracil-DNA glycosylase family protein [Vitreoscilla]AUZ03902.1 uracil-DNA glycosylase-like protein [Vitreoscilla sp. C1]UOO92175.1 hypothetical protein LVJ81_11220 [Vitreoscilla stercoraria]